MKERKKERKPNEQIKKERANNIFFKYQRKKERKKEN